MTSQVVYNAAAFLLDNMFTSKLDHYNQLFGFLSTLFLLSGAFQLLIETTSHSTLHVWIASKNGQREITLISKRRTSMFECES